MPCLRRTGPLVALLPAANLEGVGVFGFQQEEQTCYADSGSMNKAKISLSTQ